PSPVCAPATAGPWPASSSAKRSTRAASASKRPSRRSPGAPLDVPSSRGAAPQRVGRATTIAHTGPMRTVRLIPCLDVDGGRVVKGVNFTNLRDPGELPARYDAEGADEMVFYDITASSSGRATMVDLVRRTAEQMFIPLTVGGGVRTLEDARQLLRVGAD